LKLGHLSSCTEVEFDNPNWNTRYNIYRRISKESHIFPKKHITVEDYNDMVYCATVEPYHTLVVRRNGRIMISGNCWWHTIVPTNSKKKTGYPTEKPVGIIKRMIAASSNADDVILDFFAGSGTTGMAALELERRFVLIDENPEAIEVMRNRFQEFDIDWCV